MNYIIPRFVLGELPIGGEALVRQPFRLRSPVDVRRLVNVSATSPKAKGLEAHRLQRAVAGQDHQVGPGNSLAILLLDRPEQPARLVEVLFGRQVVLQHDGGVVPQLRRRRLPFDRVLVGGVGALELPGLAAQERVVVPRVGGVLSADIAVPEHEQELSFYSQILTTGSAPLWRDDLRNNRGTPVIGLAKTLSTQVAADGVGNFFAGRYRFE